jgi:phosphatidylglycerophosphatase A
MVARPNVRFLLGHPAHFVALGFGSGLAPFAPGTFGTLLAVPIFWILAPLLAPTGFLVLIGSMLLAGVWVCDKTGRDIGVEDHKAIVWDEVTAFLSVLFFTPATLAWQALAFVLFRLFDIVKPGPIRLLERRTRGGLGVMVDDLLAGFFALVCLALLRVLLPELGAWIGSGTL